MDTELTGYEVISISFDVYDDDLTHEDQADLSNSLLARYRGSTWISNSLETVVEAITEESGYTISSLSIKSINFEELDDAEEENCDEDRTSVSLFQSNNNNP